MRVAPSAPSARPREVLATIGRAYPNLWPAVDRLRLRARRPNGDRGRRLHNASALGRVRLDATGTPVDIRLLTADGREVIFPEPP